MLGVRRACDTADLGLRHGRGPGHDTTPLRVRARGLGAPGRAGWLGCALGAPNQFLDSVLFLSHCLDTVHKTFSKIIIIIIKIFEK